MSKRSRPVAALSAATYAAALLLLTLFACRGARGSGQLAATPAMISCATSVPDQDGDGLSDSCELQLATAFAPILSASADACNVIGSGNDARLGGGYLFAVAPRDSVVRIAYMPAYYRDCGWKGMKCQLPWVNCAPHAGDSEFIAIDLRRAGDSWRVTAIFLSAHCFGRGTGDCRWYRGNDLRPFEWAGEPAASAPVVWVADGRNANYPSRTACARGHMFIDSCGDPRLRYAYPIDAGRNAGSRQQPVRFDGVPAGCVASHHVDPAHIATVPGATECFWRTGARFQGWQSTGSGVTAYVRYLTQIAGM